MFDNLGWSIGGSIGGGNEGVKQDLASLPSEVVDQFSLDRVHACMNSLVKSWSSLPFRKRFSKVLLFVDFLLKLFLKM